MDYTRVQLGAVVAVSTVVSHEIVHWGPPRRDSVDDGVGMQSVDGVMGRIPCVGGSLDIHEGVGSFRIRWPLVVMLQAVVVVVVG